MTYRSVSLGQAVRSPFSIHYACLASPRELWRLAAPESKHALLPRTPRSRRAKMAEVVSVYREVEQ